MCKCRKLLPNVRINSKRKELSVYCLFPSMQQGGVQSVLGIGQYIQTVSRPLPPQGALMEEVFTLQPSHQSLFFWLQPTLTCEPRSGPQFSSQQAAL